MKRLVTALAALLPLAGCATPYGYSPGAWAYYDDNYDSGQEGYSRPITYGESAPGFPDPGYTQAPPYPGPVYPAPVYPVHPQPPSYFEQPGPDYAGARPQPPSRCHCVSRSGRPIRASQAPQPAHDPSWYSTYYSIGP